ncbi:MAG: MBL fold metallo-hydrolase [Acidimicrobiia bacterium]|nr:MBL fold metallo-hydrolase [Acidimicrobiia bacterium]
MRATLRGTRGSIARAGPKTVDYGGDTASVELRTDDGRLIILDAGSGIRSVEIEDQDTDRIDILLTHLHMDHVQGLPFFAPVLSPDYEVHVWGPAPILHTLRKDLSKYLSPPLFPVSVRDMPNTVFHDLHPCDFALGSVKISTELICHPGMTLGFRFEENGSSFAYLPDHEPAFGAVEFPDDPVWTSGFDLSNGVDVLIHDSQYTDSEYEDRVGWGHTSFSQLSAFAEMAGVSRLVTFHHDPSHDDEMLDTAHEELDVRANGYEVVAGKAGLVISW